MILPKDFNVLLSLINTYLRDKYSSLETLCDMEEIEEENLILIMKNNGYKYNKILNSFVKV